MMARHSSVLSLMVPKHIKFHFFPFFHWEKNPRTLSCLRAEKSVNFYIFGDLGGLFGGFWGDWGGLGVVKYAGSGQG